MSVVCRTILAYYRHYDLILSRIHLELDDNVGLSAISRLRSHSKGCTSEDNDDAVLQNTVLVSSSSMP